MDGLTPAGPVNPARIRAARQLIGLTQKATVERMPHPITPAALSQIESGSSSPTQTTVHDLAVALEVPETYFRARWHDEEDRGPDQPAFFRHLKSTSKRDRLRATATAGLVLDLLAAVESDVRLPEVTLPDAEVSDDSDDDEISEVADLVRRSWGFGTDPIPDVVQALERNGIAVVQTDFGDVKIDAFSVLYTQRPVVVLTKDKNSYARSRFDAAHELGHLVMHRYQEPGRRTLENQAHLFASEFLLPRNIAEQVLPTRIDEKGWRQLARLKREWGISIAALLYRTKSLSLISDQVFTNAMRTMSARGWRRIEPGDRELGPPEKPTLLRRALSLAAESWDTTPTDYLNGSGLPSQKCLELLSDLARERPRVDL